MIESNALFQIRLKSISFSLSALSLLLRAWHAGFSAGSSTGSGASSGTHDVLVLSKEPGPSTWCAGCTRHSGAESRRCEEHAQPATCRLSRRRRQQLKRQNQKAPPRKRVGYGWDDTTEPRKAKCAKHAFKLAQLGICQMSTQSEPRSAKSAEYLEYSSRQFQKIKNDVQLGTHALM